LILNKPQRIAQAPCSRPTTSKDTLNAAWAGAVLRATGWAQVADRRRLRSGAILPS